MSSVRVRGCWIARAVPESTESIASEGKHLPLVRDHKGEVATGRNVRRHFLLQWLDLVWVKLIVVDVYGIAETALVTTSPAPDSAASHQ